MTRAVPNGPKWSQMGRWDEAPIGRPMQSQVVPNGTMGRKGIFVPCVPPPLRGGTWDEAPTQYAEKKITRAATPNGETK